MQIRPLHMELTLIILVAAALAALIAWLLTHFISRARYDRQLYAKDAQLAAKDAELRSAQALRAHESELYARTLAELKASQQQAQHRGIREVRVSNAKTDTAQKYTAVFLVLCFGDSTNEEVVVPMVEREGRWRMK